MSPGLNMISHERGCIFVHIQKTGGSSLRQALNMPQNEPDKHRFAVELQAQCDPVVWQSYFKFAFVRNPWDRLVSWWAMIARNARAAREGRQRLNGFASHVVSRARTFEEFLRNCDQDFHDADGAKWIYRNQVDYIADAGGRILVDYVGRFERLQDDFTRISARLNLQLPAIPHLNRSPRQGYASYYTPDLVELVRQRYARDIEAFGYEFAER